MFSRIQKLIWNSIAIDRWSTILVLVLFFTLTSIKCKIICSGILCTRSTCNFDSIKIVNKCWWYRGVISLNMHEEKLTLIAIGKSFPLNHSFKLETDTTTTAERGECISKCNALVLINRKCTLWLLGNRSLEDDKMWFGIIQCLII